MGLVLGDTACELCAPFKCYIELIRVLNLTITSVSRDRSDTYTNFLDSINILISTFDKYLCVI